MFVQISKTMLSFCTRLTIILLLSSGFVYGQKAENALLWKISGKSITKPSYILGTYHLVNDEFLNSIAGCQKALKKTNSVMGELEVTPAIAAEMMPYMLLTEGSLEDYLNPQQMDSLSKFMLEKLGMPMTLFMKMKPIGIFLLFASSEMQKTSMVTDYKGVPMDVYVQQEARKNKKDVLSLETMKDQADLLFNSTPVNQQVVMLMEYLRKDELKNNEQESDRMNACYKAQDLNCLDSLMQSSGYSDIESDLLLKDRNEKWIPRIEEAVNNKSCFIAVGALHLAGDDGIIALLRKNGYTLSPVKSNKDVH